MPQPNEETIDDVLTSLELRLQGDEACQLVAKAKRLLKVSKAEVSRRSELENKELELKLLKSGNENLQKQLLLALQDLQKCYERIELPQREKQSALEEEKSPGSSPLIRQLHCELAHTKAMQEEDKKLIERLKKKVTKYKARNEVQLRTAEDSSEVAKTHVQHMGYYGIFGDCLKPAAVEHIAMEIEHLQHYQKKRIKEKEKEMESKDEHMEKMSWRILDLKTEKEVGGSAPV